MVNKCYFMVLGISNYQTTLKWNKLAADITARLSLFICTYDFGNWCTSSAPLVTSCILTQSFSLFCWAPLFDSTGHHFESSANPAPLDLFELVTSILVPPYRLLALQSVLSFFFFFSTRSLFFVLVLSFILFNSSTWSSWILFFRSKLEILVLFSLIIWSFIFVSFLWNSLMFWRKT